MATDWTECSVVRDGFLWGQTPDCGDPIGADVPASWTTCAQCSARSDETADGVES